LLHQPLGACKLTSYHIRHETMITGDDNIIKQYATNVSLRYYKCFNHQKSLYQLTNNPNMPVILQWHPCHIQTLRDKVKCLYAYHQNEINIGTNWLTQYMRNESDQLQILDPSTNTDCRFLQSQIHNIPTTIQMFGIYRTPISQSHIADS